MLYCRVMADVTSSNAAISACGICGQWQRAVGLLDDMRMQDVERDTVSYNAAITACRRCEQ
jgi:pentatricopeptide repeat domain (PPR motif)